MRKFGIDLLKVSDRVTTKFERNPKQKVPRQKILMYLQKELDDAIR